MPERHRILIVDDNAVDRQAVVLALQREAAEIDGVEADVLEVDTIAAAREAIGREEFSCVFLDHDLPDGTSLDLLMEVRAQGLVTPVVVLTGQRDVQTITEVMFAGAVDYLPKEKLQPELVARALRAALRFRQAQIEKQRVLDELRARDRAIAAAPNGIVITDPCQPNGPLVYVNAAFLRMTGYAEEEVIGRNCRFLQGPDTEPAAVRELHEAVCEERPCQVTLLNYRKDGTTFFNEVTISPVRDARGMLTHFVGIQSDITARHEADAERTQAEEGRKRQEAVLAAAYRREALLNRIGQAIRSATEPEAVQEAAVGLLGEALGADRCYFALYDLGRGVVTIACEWRRAELPPIRGVHPFPNTVEMFHELYHDSPTSVIADAHTAPLSAQTRANMEKVGLRSRISVALVEGDGLMATLTAAMADGPREWTGEEVTLVEAVSTQLRTAVDMARVAQREHTIAQQLQDALQPAVPAQVSGMELADYYRPALDEAGVGGDFIDVFAADKGVTFLVVGDLSGKGLAAASQVATVRNMLRFALYNGRTMAGPLTSLNRTLADNELLTGFATLFVGRYDAGDKSLTYVNCGQDAGLILRSGTGRVEPLPPTGAVLGALSGAEYTEETVTLERGDVLALFTDGLTEAGPTRTALLTGDGVAELLSQQVGVGGAGAIVARLMASVDAYAGSGVRDDQCLLVGVVNG